MSKGSGWIPLDKNLSQYFNSINREYSFIEAMYSYTLDQDKGKDGTISGYSKLWGWSRNKTRRFINCIGTPEGHKRDSKRTHEGHPIHFIDKGLWDKKDTNGTQTGHKQDTCKDTTVNPLILNPKSKEIYIPEYKEIIQYLNLESGRKFKHNTEVTKSKIKARYEDGFSLDDFKRVIRTKCYQWLNDEKLNKFLRPETLFGNKFESYLNEPEPKPKTKLQLIPGAIEKAQEQIKEFHQNG